MPSTYNIVSFVYIGRWVCGSYTNPTSCNQQSRLPILTQEEVTILQLNSVLVANLKTPRFSDILFILLTKAQKCNYLKTYKQIPTNLPSHFTSLSTDSIPKTFIPTENQCHECKGNLKGLFLATKNAKVLSMNGVLHGHAPFINICPECQMCYRYQEVNDGVHNLMICSI